MRKRLALIVAPVVLCAAAAFVLLPRADGDKESNVPMAPQLVSAHTRFGLALVNQLMNEGKGKNVFISPASVALALSMTCNGASGTTRGAMSKALALNGMTLDELNNASAALVANLRSPGPGAKLEIANSLWARKGVQFKADFMARNSSFYRADVETLDFASPKAVPTINSWVSDNTGGKIKDIVKQIDAQAILFLINAVYFKGTWTDKFDPASTQPADFTLLDGSKKNVRMMFRHGKYRWFQGKGFQAISLPYGEGRLSMYIFLPDKDSSLAGFLKTVDAAAWTQWMSQFSQSPGDVWIPRFKIEYQAELRNALTALGMGVAFSEKAADFSNMCPISPTQNVFIKSVLHKTFVEVNEAGTEAAASTKVEMGVTAVAPTGLEFRVDRPFFCAIRDNNTGEILFAGVIVDPT